MSVRTLSWSRRGGGPSSAKTATRGRLLPVRTDSPGPGDRSIWASTGFENGRLGYPTSNEYVTGPGGSVAQNYQGGVIHWGPTGSWVTYK
jgi:uncharacterized protein with LGFP repeats